MDEKMAIVRKISWYDVTQDVKYGGKGRKATKN
jgi:hypothetical protein